MPPVQNKNSGCIVEGNQQQTTGQGADAASRWGTEEAQIRAVTTETHPRPKPRPLETGGCGHGEAERLRLPRSPLARGEPCRRGQGNLRAWGPWRRHQGTHVRESAGQGGGSEPCVGQGPSGAFPCGASGRGVSQLALLPPRFHRVIRQDLASSSREESWPGRLEAPGKGACLGGGQVCAAGVEAYLSGL